MITDESALNFAATYLARGLAIVPIPPRTKRPSLPNWPALRINTEEVKKYFAPDSNIGTLLGEPSGWVIDIDLDSDDARRLADDFLPPTPATFGRASAPRSHRLYRLTSPAPTRKFLAPDGSMILELRSTGCQTVAPGSVHPSGERIVWMAPDGSTVNEWPGDPAPIDPEHLRVNLEALATACGWQAKPVKGSGAPTAPPAAPMAPAGSTTVYGARVLEAECGDVASTAEGGRNHRLNTAAFKIGQLIPHEIERSDAERALMAAARQCGLGDAEAFATIRSGLDGGAKYPREKAERVVDTFGVDLSYLDANVRDEAPPSTIEPDPGEFPEHLLNVPGLIGDVVKHNLDTAFRRQPVLALAGAIALQAILAARKVTDDRNNRTNLYLIGVAPSGGGKEHARDINKNVLVNAGAPHLIGPEDLASDAGLISDLNNQRARLYQLDELGRFLKTTSDARSSPHTFNIVSTLMKLYSTAHTTFVGKAYADADKNVIIEQPCAIVYGTTTPGHFYESLTVDSLEDGFVARLIILQADEKRPPRRPAKAVEIPTEIIDAAKWWVNFTPPGAGNMPDSNPKPMVVESTAEAMELFAELGEFADDQANANANRPGSALWTRAEQKAMRLALIYACSAYRGNPVIDEAAAAWACELAKYTTINLLSKAGVWLSDGQFDARQKWVLRIIQGLKSQHKRVTLTDIVRNTRKLTKRERAEVLENLVETGQIRINKDKGTTKPITLIELVGGENE